MADGPEDLDGTFEDLFGLRITPYPMIFRDARRHEVYTKKLTIQNVSPHLLYIRILPPKHKAFRIDSISRPKELCSGLSILRHITLDYDENAPENCILLITVNDKLVEYHLIIKPPVVEISFDPQIIDFGTIDAGFNSTTRRLTLRNDGAKATSFSIDWGHVVHNILVEPNKGVVKGKKSIHIYISIIAFEESVVESEIRIFAGKKFTVPIVAKIIIPRLEANHPNTTENFTFLDFPPTYIGLKSVTHLFVTNFSANPCMFQTLGEIGNQAVEIEISVFIIPQNIGAIKTTMEFDLVFKQLTDNEEDYKTVGNVTVPISFSTSPLKGSQKIQLNPGLKPNYIKEVGKYCSQIRFNTKIQKMKGITIDAVEVIDKNCIDLVAFPNDKQHSLRPWRSEIPCKTIFTRQTRYVPPLNSDYEVRFFDKELRNEVAKYFSNYLRREATRLKELIPTKAKTFEYMLTDKRKILCRDMQWFQPQAVKAITKLAEDYIPLGPLEMSKISTIPDVVETGPIACNSSFHFKLIIINNNKFAIRLFVRPDKRSIKSRDTKDRYKMSGLSQTEIEFTFLSSWPGFYASTKGLFVNDSIIIPVEVLADVKQRSLYFSTKTLHFTCEDTKKYIDIVNPLNIGISFFWNLTVNNFIIIPTFGVVAAYSFITVQIIYNINIEGPNKTTVEFTSGDRSAVEVKLFATAGKRRVVLETPEITFENAPLNYLMFRKIHLQNLEAYTVAYEVIDTDLLDDINIFPKQGYIRSHSRCTFYVSAVFKNCISFNVAVNFKIVKGKVITLVVKGNVVYPNIKISPLAITFPKITACTTSKQAITLTNTSLGIEFVKFDMSDYQDFKISYSENYWDSGITDNIVLKPNKSVMVYLDFVPSDAMNVDFYLSIIFNGFTQEQFRLICPDADVFRIFPENGTFTSKETRVFNITFLPKSGQPYYFYTLLINRFIYRTVRKEDYKDTYSVHSDKISIGSDSNFKQDPSIHTTSSTSLAAFKLEEDKVPSIMAEVRKSFIRIYMYGIAETPTVAVVPDELCLKDLKINQREVRTLRLINKSSRLPIIFHYKKVPFIDLEQQSYFIKPSQEIEITVFIIPQNIGAIKTTMEFDLVFKQLTDNEEDYKTVGNVTVPVSFSTSPLKGSQKIQLNPGLKPNYIKEVGKYCSQIRFNTKIQKMKGITVDAVEVIDKNCTDLVAFPNDKQHSLRPWRSEISCKTIFARQTRYVPPLNSDYEVRFFDKELRNEVAKYFSNYLRREATRLKELIPTKAKTFEYMLTDKRKILCRDMQWFQPQAVKAITKLAEDYIPLGPLEMSKISTIPDVVETGPIACNSSFHFKLTIINNNKFAIRLFVRPDKRSIKSRDTKDRYKMSGLSQTEIEFTFLSSWPGFYASTIGLFVNDSIMIPVEVLADVKQRSLYLSTKTLHFTCEDTKKYIDIANPLNVGISFFWNLTVNNFIIIPTFGVVAAYSFITVQIIYNINIEGPNKTTVEFNSGDRSAVEVKLFATAGKRRVVLETPEMTFENAPLNYLMFRKTHLQNLEAYTVAYEVVDTELLDDINIFPKQGYIRSNSRSTFYVSAVFKNCINFNVAVNFKIVKGKVITLVVKGNVVYPKIRISPLAITFPKIPACTTSKQAITLTNTSLGIEFVKFDMSDYQDFKISYSENYWDSGITDNIVLKPNKSVMVYLHFVPSDAMKVDFYLPIILNGILGPPSLQDVITMKTVYYLRTSVDTPVNIPCVKVRALAIKALVHFSKFCVFFDLLPWKKEKNCSVKISNPQPKKEDVYIGIDNLTPPFEINHESGRPITILKNVIHISLGPNQETVLAVKFKPDTYGCFKMLLPIFLAGVTGPEYHRAWVIRGVHNAPSIGFEKSIICIRKMITPKCPTTPQSGYDSPNTKKVFFCRPLPLGVRSSSSKKFMFKNHLADCEINTSTDLNFLTITWNTKTIKRISSLDYVIKANFICSPKESANYLGSVTVECSCGGSWNATVIGCSENAFVTNYAFSETFLPNRTCKTDSLSRVAHFHQSNTNVSLTSFDISSESSFTAGKEINAVDFFSSYPFFPTQPGPLLTFLKRTVKVCEKWIFSQGFFQRQYYGIPSDLSYVAVEESNPKAKKKAILFIPLAQLLINLLGPQMAKYLNLQPDPGNDFERLRIALTIYRKILDFLTQQGAYFTYLRPEHLLEYRFFLIYKERILPTEKDPSTITQSLGNLEQYYQFVKQSLLDVFLQTYKVLYLRRLEDELLNKMKEKVDVDDHPINRFVETLRNSIPFSNIFSVPEIVIMRWLEYHFNRSKDILWPGAKLELKDVSIFGEGFDDGLVLSAVTLIYCPYLKFHFKKIYTPPNSTEEMNHNINNLLRCWEKLNFSYKVSAKDFTALHSIQLLMLSAYLYDVLPHMYPMDTIEFKAGLSQTKEYVLQLTNSNNFPIAYLPIILPFDTSDFKVDKPMYVIKPKGSCYIKITYYAKFAKIINGTLLLSGECSGYHYSKNKAVNIIGIPDLSYMTTTISYPVRLYECNRVEFIVTSPYAQQATYELQMSYEPISTVEELDTIIYQQYLHKLKSGRFTPLDRSYDFDDNGVCTIHGILTTIRNVDMYVYLFFKNPVVGDFTILISLAISGQLQEEVLEVKLPKTIEPEKPLNILKIPRRNTLFWSAVRGLILEITEGREREFWKKAVDTAPGMQFVSKLLTDNQMIPKSATMTITTCQPMVYRVKYRSNNVILPKFVTIDQECDPGYIKLPIIFLNSNPKDFSFEMTTEDGIERAYFIRFVPYVQK